MSSKLSQCEEICQEHSIFQDLIRIVWYLYFNHSFTHSSSGHYYASFLWDSEREGILWDHLPVNWLAIWVKDLILPSTPVSEEHKVLYISLHYETQTYVCAFITTYKRKKPTKTNNKCTTDGPLIANQKNPQRRTSKYIFHNAILI